MCGFRYEWVKLFHLLTINPDVRFLEEWTANHSNAKPLTPMCSPRTDEKQVISAITYSPLTIIFAHLVYKNYSTPQYIDEFYINFLLDNCRGPMVYWIHN